MVAEASQRLADRERVTAAEAAAWVVLDDKPLLWRGDNVLSTNDAKQ